MLNIGLYSPSSQFGKTTIANYIMENYGYKKLVLASTLKKMTEVFLTDLGYSQQEVRRMIYEDLKESPLEKLDNNITPRDLMVTLGTNWGREYVDKNIWIKIALTSRESEVSYISDDIRYLNEYEVLRNSGFKIIRVDNPRVPLRNNISEGNLEECEFDYHIVNDGDFNSLYYKVEDMLKYFNRS